MCNTVNGVEFIPDKIMQLVPPGEIHNNQDVQAAENRLNEIYIEISAQDIAYMIDFSGIRFDGDNCARGKVQLVWVGLGPDAYQFGINEAFHPLRHGPRCNTQPGSQPGIADIPILLKLFNQF